MRKLVLFAVALLVASGASAYAQSKDSSNEHATTTRHHRAMAPHARWQGYEGTMNYQPREIPAPMVIGPYDDPDAEGRTNGG